MRTGRLLIVVALLSVAVAAPLAIQVSNSQSHQRNREVLSLNWNDLKAKVDKLTADNARVLGDDGKALVSQPIDNDGDGAIDELLFLADVTAGQTRKFSVVADSSIVIPEIEGRVYARYVPERKDDFAWENDVVGFRAYGPALEKGPENCGIDCFFKRVKYPILDKWYKGEKFGKSYHIDYGEGYDGYKVGSSLGCGGTAIWHNDKLNLSKVYRKWKQFSNGPLRASFALSYGPWEVAGQKITETKRITLDVGKRLFRVDDSFFVNGKPARLDVAVGVTTHEGSAQAYSDKAKGILYAWEEIDKYGLGTGVIVSPGIIKEYKLIESKEKFGSNAVFIVDTGPDGRFTYYAGFGWERAGETTTRVLWEEYLKIFIDDAANPLRANMR